MYSTKATAEAHPRLYRLHIFYELELDEWRRGFAVDILKGGGV